MKGRRNGGAKSGGIYKGIQERNELKHINSYINYQCINNSVKGEIISWIKNKSCLV